MAITGKAIMERAAIILNDLSGDRWTPSELCQWINAGQKAVVLAKPSALSRSRVLTMAAGTLQRLPTAANAPVPLALLDIVRNLASAADTPRVGGRTIKPVSRDQLDAIDINWHSATANKVVKHFIYDEQNPLEFYVYPPNTGTGFVEGVLSEAPTLLEPTGGAELIASYDSPLDLPEPYSEPLLDYVLYRAFSKDAPQGVSARAQDHYSKFATALGLKIQVEGASSPNNRRSATA